MSFPDPSLSLATLLGVPLFSPAWYMPDFLEGRIGRWRLARSGFCLNRGYYSGLWGVSGMPVLMCDSSGNGESWENWMSLSPHEIESQELGCRYARGHTVVMGLGMGWVAVNMALNPAVRKVTIIERDPEVIDLFQLSGALNALQSAITDKIRVVRADALEWRPEESVDFLYADIWQRLEEPQTLDDVRRMQANVQADVIYFWGQELAIHTQVVNKPDSYGRTEWAESVQRCVAETIALPLLLPGEFDYPEMIAEVVRLRRQRWPNCINAEITLRPITDDDLAFLFQLYASTRAEEKALAGWGDEQWQQFILMQFDLQHSQYMRNYDHPSYDIIMHGQIPVGRLYVNRGQKEILIVDISLLPDFRGRGIGASLLRNVLREGENRGIPVTLHVERNNPALNLYRRLGFREEHFTEVFSFMKWHPGQPAANP